MVSALVESFEGYLTQKSHISHKEGTKKNMDTCQWLKTHLLAEDTNRKLLPHMWVVNIRCIYRLKVSEATKNNHYLHIYIHTYFNKIGYF